MVGRISSGGTTTGAACATTLTKFAMMAIPTRGWKAVAALADVLESGSSDQLRRRRRLMVVA